MAVGYGQPGCPLASPGLFPHRPPVQGGVSRVGVAILVASGKGGTGKTSFCANVAVALCAMGEKVLLVDADAGLRSLDLVLGMSDSLLFSYADVARGDATLKEAAVHHPIVRNLRVLTAPAALERREEVSDAQLCELIRRARAHFSYVIIDCPAGIGREISAFARAVQRAVIVSTGDALALRGAQKAAQTLGQSGVQEVHIVVNRVRRGMIDAGATVNIDRAMDASGLSLLGAVPEDDSVAICAGKGQVLLLESEGDAQRAYGNIARRLRGERVRLLQGLKGQYE